MGKAEVIVGLLFILHKVQLSSALPLVKDRASMSKSNQEAMEHDQLGHQLSVEKRLKDGDGEFESEPESEERNFTPESLSRAIEKLRCTFVDCNNGTTTLDPMKIVNTTTTTPASTINPTTERSFLGDFSSIFPAAITNLFTGNTNTTSSTTDNNSTESTSTTAPTNIHSSTSASTPQSSMTALRLIK